MSPLYQALLASLLSSVLGLMGGFVLLANHQGIRRVSRYLVSLAAGTLLAAAFFDILASAVEEFPEQVNTTLLWLVAGFVLFFMIEKLLLWHHHTHHDEDHAENKVLGSLIIIGDALHNLIDGIIIGASFLISPALGVTTSVAVLAHEIPQEIGDFTILLHSGMARKKIIMWNLIGALISPIGAALTVLLAQQIEGIELPLLGIAAGSFIYIAAADLVPEIHREKNIRKTIIDVILLLGGILLIIAIGNLFPHSHG